jgi:branched-chain amino acid transport system permease protein
MGYLIHLLIYFDIYAIVALSLNLLVGYAGLLTFAHAGYFAVGAYTYALLSVVGGFGVRPASLVAVLIAAFLSLAISLPSWRLKGDFFILVSLSVQTFFFSLYYNWTKAGAPLGSWSNLTNGPFGITNIPKPAILGFRITDPGHFLVFATCIALLCAFVCWRLQASPWGRLLISMREDELACRGLGKNTRLLKVQTLALSSAFVAMAGTIYAAYAGYVDPTSSSLEEGILMLSMVLVGGVGNLRGPIVGALLLTAFPEMLRFLHFPDAQASNIRLAFYGLLLVLMMHLRPQGLSGNYRMK